MNQMAHEKQEVERVGEGRSRKQIGPQLFLNYKGGGVFVLEDRSHTPIRWTKFTEEELSALRKAID